MAKPCLWLVRMKQNDILKLHEVELTNRYGSDGQGLDIVEMAAVYACLASDSGFPNDPSGKKAAYMSRLEDSLKSTLIAHDAGKLPPTKQRVPCYTSTSPLFKHRQSLLERFITQSSATVGRLSRVSFGLMGRASQSGTPSASAEADVELRSSELKQRPLSRGQGAICDDIPNPLTVHGRL